VQVEKKRKKVEEEEKKKIFTRRGVEMTKKLV
jgi:hypothetical protein